MPTLETPTNRSSSQEYQNVLDELSDDELSELFFYIDFENYYGPDGCCSSCDEGGMIDDGWLPYFTIIDKLLSEREQTYKDYF